MMTLDDLKPTQDELDLVADYSDQVAIGYIIGKRRHEKQKRRDKLKSYFTGSA